MERRGGVWEKDPYLDSSSSDDTPADLKYQGGGGRSSEEEGEVGDGAEGGGGREEEGWSGEAQLRFVLAAGEVPNVRPVGGPRRGMGTPGHHSRDTQKLARGWRCGTTQQDGRCVSLSQCSWEVAALLMPALFILPFCSPLWR